MFKNIICAACLCSVFITGCVSKEELERRRTEFELSECHKLGFKDNTEKMGECRLQVRSIVAQQETATATRVGNAQQNYWNTYNAATRNYTH